MGAAVDLPTKKGDCSTRRNASSRWGNSPNRGERQGVGRAGIDSSGGTDRVDDLGPAPAAWRVHERLDAAPPRPDLALAGADGAEAPVAACGARHEGAGDGRRASEPASPASGSRPAAVRGSGSGAASSPPASDGAGGAAASSPTRSPSVGRPRRRERGSSSSWPGCGGAR